MWFCLLKDHISHVMLRNYHEINILEEDGALLLKVCTVSEMKHEKLVKIPMSQISFFIVD